MRGIQKKASVFNTLHICSLGFHQLKLISFQCFGIEMQSLRTLYTCVNEIYKYFNIWMNKVCIVDYARFASGAK